MPLQKIVRRRLLSLLQPWLQEEPEFDLKLGFVQSFAVAENLRLDVSVLNQLLDVPALLFFKDVTIGRLSIRFSNWYAPAFSIEVHGVRVTVSFEKPEGEGYMRRSRTSKHAYSERVRKKLSALDPEGCALHHLLERILFAVPSRKDFSTSFVNVILKHCHLEVHHIHVDVQFPILNDVFVCFVELEEFNARSKHLDDRCLTRGLLSTVFLPLNESSYILNGIGFKVGLNQKDCAERILLSSDLCMFIKLSDLQLADCSLCFPELAFSVSPDDISIYIAFDRLLSNNSNHPISARELWRLAASRIGDVTVTPRLSLQRLVGIIGQWVHYVDAYENLLLLMGYSSGLLVNRSISQISWKNSIFVSARHHWKEISDTEKRLPVEGIALARRVARHRAALKVQSDSDTLITSPSKFFRLFFPILVLMWNVFSKIIHSSANFLFWRKEIEQDPYINGGLGSLTRDSCQRCFILNFGKMVITVSPTNKVQPSVIDKLQSHTGIAYTDFHSISFCIDALLFLSIEDIFEQRVFLSFGQMKVMPTSFEASPKSSKMNMGSSSVKENTEEGPIDMESILWVEPAKLFFISDANDAQAEGSCAFHLESFLGKICLSWKDICNSFIESEIEYSENPSLLCKVERSFMYPGPKNPDFGFPECGLILGKLNLVLAHSSVSSVSLLLGQIQHFIWWEDIEKTSIGSSCLGKPEICWANKFEYYVKGWITTLLEMLPEKHIHLGVFVDGPSLKILHKEPILGGQEISDIVSQDGFDLTFDFHEIEVAVGSPSLFGMAPLVDLPGSDDAEAESLRLEPQAINIPKPKNDKYVSWGKISYGFHLRLNGLNAYLRKAAKNHQFQIFQLKPVIVQISSFR